LKPIEPVERSDSDESDEGLMERFSRGDSAALDALFRRHAGAVHGYLRRLTGNAQLSEDLVQQTFVSLVRGRGRYQRGSKFKPWLYAIATNAARDAHRRGKFERVSDDGTVGAQETVDPIERDEGLERQVRAALAQLPGAQREAIVLHRFEGLSFGEIAQATGLSESAVKVRAHRGYEKLRELLKGLWKGEAS
jgi:RNA polymerase sigma-70 factor (ECF subfamily)